MRPRIAFQGIPGAFSELAVQHWWPDAEAMGFESFARTLDAVIAGTVEAAVIPVHNRIAGPVHAALSALDAVAPLITRVDDTEVPVELCLLAHPAHTSETRIVRVMSHPMALAQCGPFLATLGAEVAEHADTAGAARDVRDGGDPTVAAIAAERAAVAYGLQVLARAIQAQRDNRTRFVRVERRPSA
ncbi:MAG: hypothetical protein MUE41_14565 [Gemmatimonadaceae bacterium]|jgi:prephenate dehydratase|nr:hypothetical protein [Gemmatimonadaceae bacterium]